MSKVPTTASSQMSIVNPDLQIKQDDKFFSRLLSKEKCPTTDQSFRGACGAVPFVWETQPGTPKHKFSDTSLPPLTPPPSYQFNSNKDSNSIKKPSNGMKLIHAIFPRLGGRKSNEVSSSPSSSSASSWSSWSSSSLSSVSSNKISSKTRRRRPSLSSFDYMADEEEEERRFGKSSSSLCGIRVCYSVKNRFTSFVGNGSDSH